MARSNIYDLLQKWHQLMFNEFFAKYNEPSSSLELRGKIFFQKKA